MVYQISSLNKRKPHKFGDFFDDGAVVIVMVAAQIYKGMGLEFAAVLFPDRK